MDGHGFVSHFSIKNPEVVFRSSEQWHVSHAFGDQLEPGLKTKMNLNREPNLS